MRTLLPLILLLISNALLLLGPHGQSIHQPALYVFGFFLFDVAVMVLPFSLLISAVLSIFWHRRLKFADYFLVNMGQLCYSVIFAKTILLFVGPLRVWVPFNYFYLLPMLSIPFWISLKAWIRCLHDSSTIHPVPLYMLGTPVTAVHYIFMAMMLPLQWLLVHDLLV